MSHTPAAAEGSQLPAGMDVEEMRALRLEKMRRKQVFALDMKHINNQMPVKVDNHMVNIAENDIGEPEVIEDALVDKPEGVGNNRMSLFVFLFRVIVIDCAFRVIYAGGMDDIEVMDENITGKKAAGFFEKWKAIKKNKYAQKSKFSSELRAKWSEKFLTERIDALNASRPAWMSMDKDKKLISAIIKSHHLFIRARDEQELRFCECCCCFTCCCCVHIDDIGGRYIDIKFTIADLMQAVNDQDIYMMLDVLYHPSYPVSVNEVDINGESPLYRILTDTMQNAFDKVEEDDGDALIFTPSPFWVPRSMRKKATKMRGKKEWVIKILLYAGGDINFISHTKAFEVGSLLHFAVEKNLFAYAQWLVENRNCEVICYTTMLNRTPLMLACLKGHSELVMYLLQRGSISVLNHQDKRGWSALHFAAGFCDAITVKALLIAGADKFARNGMGRLPVDEGLSRGKQDNVNVLLTHNAFDPIKDSIDRLNHLKKYHDEDIDHALKDARYRMKLKLSR